MANFHVLFDGRMIQRRMHGMAKHLISLINGLNEVAPENKYSVILNNQHALEHFGDGVDIVWAKTKFMSPFELIEIPKIISKVKPDIFHNPSFVPVVPKIDIPYLMTIHDLIHLSQNRPFWFLVKMYYEFIVKRACRNANIILTVSENSRNEVSSRLKLRKDHLTVIYNGVEDKFFKANDAERLKITREKYNLPEKYILYSGNTKEYKNIKGLIEAYQYSGAGYPLVITAYWDDIKKYLKTSIKPENIICLGDVPGIDIHYIYKGASVFLFLSLQEGFAISLVEAFASGIPVITSNRSSMPEVSSGAAIELDPYDYPLIANYINRLLNDTQFAAQKAKDGLERAKEFTIQNMAKRVLDVYFQILPKKNLQS